MPRSAHSPCQALLTKWTHIGNHLEVAVTMKQKHVMIDCDLSDATIDRASNGLADSAKIEIDSRSVSPRIGTTVEILLSIEVLAKQAPLAFIPCALQQLQLLEPSQDGLVAVESGFEDGRSSESPFA